MGGEILVVGVLLGELYDREWLVLGSRKVQQAQGCLLSQFP